MAASGGGTRRSLLGIRGQPIGRMRALLESAATIEPGNQLAGRMIATVFFEDSTRTMTSFTLAGRGLGAVVVDLSTGSSSVKKGETVIDTVETLASMGAEALVVRAPHAGTPELIARAVRRVCVINAGDGRHEHPTQALGDALTIAEALGRDNFDFRGLRVAIVGDVGSSRVARSNIAMLTGLGARVVCAGPPALVPRSLESLGCAVSWSMDDALAGAHLVMMLRIQFERSANGTRAIASPRAYRAASGMTDARAAALPEHVLVMHPGPTNRGLEIDPGVADGPRSLIRTQVANGVRARMAVLVDCLAGD
jgi:aspartate carbamoyltransferase catalytic subunit